MKLILRVSVILILLPIIGSSQDGRIDTLISINETSKYLLKNNINSEGVWTVDLIKITDIKEGVEIDKRDTIVQIKHKRYDNFYLEIQEDVLYQFVMDKNKRYYVYSDIYAQPEKGIDKYTECLYANASYPKKAQAKKIEGLAIMMLYINKEGCIDKIDALSNLGYGIEKMAKKAVKSCDCKFIPSQREEEPVNTIWITPMRFKF